jgi:hypothetical protein
MIEREDALDCGLKVAGPGMGCPSAVMPGPRPGIHVFSWREDVDARGKPAHDEWES